MIYHTVYVVGRLVRISLTYFNLQYIQILQFTNVIECHCII